MKNRLLPIAATAALAAGLTFAQAPAAPPVHSNTAPRQQRRMAMHEKMMQELNLTATQKAEAKEIFQQARDKCKPLREQIMADRDEMHAAVKADDQARIRSLAAKEGKTRGELIAIRSEAMAKFYAKLTPEQRTKADQLHQQMKQRMRERWEQERTGE
jgi:Spy/CpxP family protein refolding chaperone